MKKTFVALLAAMLLVGCQHNGVSISAAEVSVLRGICANVRPWDVGFQRRLAEEIRKLPRDHVFVILAQDAVNMRDAIRICRRLGE